MGFWGGSRPKNRLKISVREIYGIAPDNASVGNRQFTDTRSMGPFAKKPYFPTVVARSGSYSMSVAKPASVD